MPDFSKNKGAEVAEAAAKGGREGVEYFSVKEGDTRFVRPLTDKDELITVQVHMGVPTKKNDKATNWPKMMSAVCQNDQAFIAGYRNAAGEPCAADDQGATAVYEDGYGHCYIHENMAEVQGKFGGSIAKTRPQVWGLFALREPVMDGTKVKGFRDVMEKFTDADGVVHSIPKIVVVSQSWSNFWGAFASSAFMSGTICDMDFSVSRTGQADYTIAPGRATPDHAPGTESWSAYTRALELRGLSVEKVVTDQSSPKYYGRFFDPSVTNEEDEKDGGSAGAGDAGAVASEVAPEVAQATRDKMAAAFGSTQPT